MSAPPSRERRRRGAGKERPQPAGRFSSLAVALLVALTVVAGRLVYVQIVKGPEYAAAASSQRTRDITVSPERGFIYDREGEVLAESMEARTIYAVPDAVKDKPAAAAAIANAIGGDAAVYEERLSRDSGFVYIARKVDVAQAGALKELGLEGLGFLEDSRRVYPSNELACQVLGFVGVDDEGLSGLELYYEELLGGAPGRLIGERDSKGRPIPGGITYEEEAVDGEDVVLTIDKDIQYQTQVALNEAVERWGAKAGSVVVMDPRNGEILAMASSPQFNPNRFAEGDEEAFRNRAIVDTYEPGSTIKSLTAAAVIDAGLYGPDSVFELPPTIQIGGRTIHESHDRAAVSWTLTDIVTQSSNVGAVKLGLALGEESLYDYFSRFGLTEKTGVDFPGEVKGWLGTPDSWSPSSLATITFGQGVSMTPLQLARALGAIANGGNLVTPHFLKESSVETDKAPRLVTERAISEETARQMRVVLTDVVNEGTGSAAAVPGYEVAGKTGTAQIAIPGGYSATDYTASFVGFFPARDPRICILVALEAPKPNYHGGTVAAPVFAKIGAATARYLEIPPDHPDEIIE